MIIFLFLGQRQYIETIEYDSSRVELYTTHVSTVIQRVATQSTTMPPENNQTNQLDYLGHTDYFLLVHYSEQII